MRQLLTKKEVAKILGVSTRTIDRYRAMNFDLGVVSMPGGGVRFDASRIQIAVESGRFTKRDAGRKVVMARSSR